MGITVQVIHKLPSTHFKEGRKAYRLVNKLSQGKAIRGNEFFKASYAS